MITFPKISVIGGGNMANALVSGWIKQNCPLSSLHIIDVNEDLRKQWEGRGVKASSAPDHSLGNSDVWIFAVKPQQMREVVLSVKPFLGKNTLIISIAAGISIASLAGWLGTEHAPYSRVVRCMPNTPALVGAGITGLAALSTVSDAERLIAGNLLKAVGEIVWVDSDEAIDAVTALSGSGPAYVFLFIESLISGAMALGLTADQARMLALGTLSGSTLLASQSSETPAVLRERVTSKGGTTAAALDVFNRNHFTSIVAEAMAAADRRASELSAEFGK